MQEAADGSRTTGWVKGRLAAWAERPTHGRGERGRGRDTETQRERQADTERILRSEELHGHRTLCSSSTTPELRIHLFHEAIHSLMGGLCFIQIGLLNIIIRKKMWIGGK